MRLSIWLRSCLALALTAAIARADDGQWGHWRGPRGNGVSPTARPPISFGGENNHSLRWKTAIPGRGSSSPVVWNDALFVTTAVPVADGSRELDFRLICLDRETGDVRWTRSAVRAVPHEGTHETNGYASASPCTDGSHIYAHFGSRGLFCYTLAGDLVWQRDFGDMQVRNGFGEGSSPTLVEGLIIVPWDHEGPSMLFAVDKLTGKSVWEVARDEPTCWATPLVTTDSGGTRQVVMNGQTMARGYDLATGRELWRCGGQTARPCASAVAADGVAYIASGFRGAFAGAFDLAGRGDLAGTPSVRWSKDRDTPDIASPLLSDGRLFYFKEKTGLLSCIDAATGSSFFAARRLPGLSRIYASPVAANGHIYLTDRSGAITVIKDGPSADVVAENSVGEGVDATPAPVGDALFIRGEAHVFCMAQP
jgi:outer membrane protein assembly factor BamB